MIKIRYFFEHQKSIQINRRDETAPEIVKNSVADEVRQFKLSKNKVVHLIKIDGEKINNRETQRYLY